MAHSYEIAFLLLGNGFEIEAYILSLVDPQLTFSEELYSSAIASELSVWPFEVFFEHIISSPLQRLQFLDNCGIEMNAIMLHYAAEHLPLEKVMFLVERDVEIESVDIYGRTPLIIAAETGQNDKVKYLLENEADTDIFDNDDQTARQKAFLNRNYSTVKLIDSYTRVKRCKS